MSFKKSFGGFAVVHAPFACPERRQHFERELPRVGVDEYCVVEARRVVDTDVRLQRYSGRAQAVLSLIDAFLDAVDLAEGLGWESVVILEDDVAFRKDFERLWAPVEENMHSLNWGILVLHRLPDGKWVTPEPLLSKTQLVPILHNTGAYCVIVRHSFYAAFRQTLHTCIARGYPCDFFYGVFSSLNPGRIYATNRNLTGQAKGLASTLTPGLVRAGGSYSRFRSAGFPTATLLNSAYFLYSRLRQ